MAAPTSVRVEAIGEGATRLYWAYAGTNPVDIYRSTDGSTYSLISTAYLGTLEYEDSGLVAGTKYWYKLSDDSGSSFSTPVSVWSHACVSPNGQVDTGSMPRFGGLTDEQQVEKLDEMAERIEAALGRLPQEGECVACPEDGAVVIDCSNGCKDWMLVVDQEINSISIHWCNEGTINPIVPPGEGPYGVCGWPAGFGFTGDECTKAPLSGGVSGKWMSVPFGGGAASPAGTKSSSRYAKKPPAKPTMGGGGAGGGGCTCTPKKNGGLALQCCASRCSLGCQSTTKAMDLLACGGKSPYTWSKTGNVALSRTTGERVKVTPPANSGSAVAGNAYNKALGWQSRQGTPGSCPVCNPQNFTGTNGSVTYGCNDQLLQNCGAGGGCTTVYGTLTAGFHDYMESNIGGPCGSGFTCLNAPILPSVPPTLCDDVKSRGKVGDCRTAPMISAGCNPCGLSDGATVTVTDSAGVAVTITVKA